MDKKKIMEVEIKLDGISRNVFFKGKAFNGEKLLNNSDVIKMLDDVKNVEDFRNIISDLSGFFYLVVELDDFILLATDIVRSYPLFYKIRNNKIFINENAISLRNKESFSFSNIDVFLSCGYVIGNETLYKNIYQVEAASIVSISKIDGKMNFDSYYTIKSENFKDYSKELFFDQLNKVYHRIVLKLLNYAQGRTILLPLSAGYDSRLLLFLLKSLNVRNVICYSYGCQDGYDTKRWEIDVSRKVANDFGYKWFCIPYTRLKWYELLHSNEGNEFLKYVSRGTSLIAYQEWLAVAEMRKNKLIPDDAIFIPGHSGDFIAGSHIPVNFNFQKVYAQDEIRSILCSKHFNLFSISKSILMDLIMSYPILKSVCNGKECLDILEIFDWKERQSKHICNSARVYEFYGYDWYFPLWDKEIVDLWYSIPYEQKLRRKLFFEYMKNNFNSSISYNPSLLVNIVNSFFYRVKLVSSFSNQWGLYNKNRFSILKSNIQIPKILNKSNLLLHCKKKMKYHTINGLNSLYTVINLMSNNCQDETTN